MLVSMRCTSLCLLVVLNCLKQFYCAHILLISNVVSHSHSMWYNKLATLLVLKGHKIILLDTDLLKTQVGNVTHFLIEDAYAFGGMNFTAEMMEDYSEMTTSDIGNIDFYFTFSDIFCNKFIHSNGLKNLMKTYNGKKIDLIIMDYYCDSFLGLVPYFDNPPFIIATAFSDPEMVLSKISLYDNPSYVPARMFSSFPTTMCFTQRMKNTLIYLYLHLKLLLSYVPHEEANAKLIFGSNTPPLNDIGRNVSLVIVNTHFAISGAKPLPPSVIPVAGFHIESPKLLPKNIQTFLDGATDGALLFSFGSNITPDLITASKVTMYIQVFSSIPQRIIWKFDEALVKDKIPPNVMIVSWVPQNDILAHKNIVGFISHGGLLGTQEAMYHGVPIIGVPFSIDQASNIERIAREGFGIKQSFKHITYDSLKQAILSLTRDESYKQKMMELSRIIRDRPMSPKDTMEYWIEYVLRNKNHLKYIRSSAANLSFYQLLLLDVILAITCPVIFIIIVTRCAIKRVMRSFSKNINKPKEKVH